MSAPKFTRTTLETPSGARLAVYQCEPPEGAAARGVVHINHGLAEHAARYRDFAGFLAGRGYHVIAQDHRGHGATEAPDGGPRRFADQMGWEKLMQDTAAVNDFARRRHPGLPVIIFGHSMGGVIAFNHVLRSPRSVQAAAIWNSNMALGSLIPVMRILLTIEALFRGRNGPSKWIDALTFKAWGKRFQDQRTAFDWLSRDPAAVDAYIEDELCGWTASISLWRDFLTGIAHAESKTSYRAVPRDMPLHLLGGQADPATDEGAALEALDKRLKSLGFRRTRLTLLPGFRHETLNEIDARPVIEDFTDWLDECTQD